MTSCDPMPAPGVQTFGYKPDHCTVEYAYGMQGEFAKPAPDGRRRRVRVLMGDPAAGKWEEIGWVYFDPRGDRERVEFNDLWRAYRARLMRDDPRVVSFVERYPARLSHMGAVDFNRQWPLQLPFVNAVLRPGDWEVVG